jgi:CubicO group peptidase (beta-lactamase class C family)
VISALFAAVLFLAAGCTGQAAETADSVAAFSEYLDEQIPRLMDRYGVPGVSMALVLDGEPVWTGAYGYADLEHGKKMTVEAICRAESITKSVTAWGVMRLVEQGFIDLDAPVQEYLGGWRLPETGYSEQEVTVRRLLSGSAGMPLGTIGESLEYVPGSDMPSLREYLNREAILAREPGAGFLYSNPGFNLLELLVEEVTGRDFAEYMAGEVLIPLGMDNASFEWEQRFVSAVPTGYELNGTPVPPYVYPVKASGGLLADAEGIARFVSAGMTGPHYTDFGVLQEMSIRRIHTPQVDICGMFGIVSDSYGFGHFLETLSDGSRAVWHGGQGHGWMTHFHSVPESGDGIVILTNSGRSWPFIAEVLHDWARWCGFASVGFARITSATVAFQVLIGIVVLISLWLLYRLARGLVSGKRRWTPLSGKSVAPRVLQAAAGIGGIAVLTWSAAQPYLFVTSIFPADAPRAGLALLVLAILLILSAVFPRVHDRKAVESS